MIAGGRIEFLIIVGGFCTKNTFSLLILLMKLVWDSSAGAGVDEAQLCSELELSTKNSLC